jgi:penicillin amidase
MRFVRFIALFLFTTGLVWLLDGIRHPSVPLAAGRFLDPFHGFWQNMEKDSLSMPGKLKLDGLKGKVTVHYDERRVPHIFAENEHDLYLAQGFVTAHDRLWQMEFQTHAASGRLSEIISDPRVLNMDRLRRRTGMVKAAETALEAVQQQPEYLKVLDAYTHGVNAYIQSLKFKHLPIEYKLLDYRPEPWTNLKTCLLLKMMAWDLTGGSDDFEQTHFREVYGAEEYNRLFAPIMDSVPPIVPRGTAFAINPVVPPAPSRYDPSGVYSHLKYPKPAPETGSNNWAVSGSKTASGFPILANDPHLTLRLPSLWYEIQLSTPEHSVYGVSLPGSPCVVIGFNRNVAWGVTNASRDVLDWYNIQFTDSKRTEYRHGGQNKPVQRRIETIGLRGGGSFMDTVLYTHHGPVVFEEKFSDLDSIGPLNVAMRWAGADSSMEIRTLYLLNKAQNHSDYRNALTSFFCPGQNFIFISKGGDVAITQNGRFPNKWKGQGEFVLDGSDPMHDWQGYIPMEHNPHVLNPSQGFIFSSNQVVTDSAYPYDVSGNYDYTRCRRIHQALQSMQKITVEDMQRLQNDNFNVKAAEFLPMMLAQLDAKQLNNKEKEWSLRLGAWNHLCDPELEEPALYDFWEKNLMAAIWEDDSKVAGKVLDYPNAYLTLHAALRKGPLVYVDDLQTEITETLGQVLTATFKSAVRDMDDFSKNQDGLWPTWQNVNNVRVMHLSRQMAFSYDKIKTGGNAAVVNATRQNNGASWRMVVELGEKPNAWGVYPGGQSGNPGSVYYANGIQPWAEGKYFRLHFLEFGKPAIDAIRFTQILEGNNP